MDNKRKVEHISESIKAIVGSSNAIGETNFDNQSNENLGVKEEITWLLLNDLLDSARNIDSHLSSVNKNGKKAVNALKNMRDVINEILEDYEEDN